MTSWLTLTALDLALRAGMIAFLLIVGYYAVDEFSLAIRRREMRRRFVKLGLLND